MQKSLTSTLVFQLKPDENGQRLLNNGQVEARRVVNEVFRLDQEGYEWSEIEEIIQDRSSHVKNTTQRLFDKALDARGISFELVPESHTSKCSFYDEESVEHHEEYAGERVERGLFEASDGTRYNADVNGAVNMARKSIGKPNSELFSSAEGLERAVDAPRRISLSGLEESQTLKETSLEALSSREAVSTAE